MIAKFLLSRSIFLVLILILVFYLGDLNPIPYCFIAGLMFYIFDFSVAKIYGWDGQSFQAITTSYLFKSKWQLLNKLNFLIFFTFFGVLFEFLDIFYTVSPALRVFVYFIFPGYIFQKLLCFLRSRQK